MGGKSAAPAAAPIAPPTPTPDANAAAAKVSTDATAASYASQNSGDGEKKSGIGNAATPKVAKDPASVANAAPSGGLSSSAVLTG